MGKIKFVQNIPLVLLSLLDKVDMKKGSSTARGTHLSQADIMSSLQKILKQKKKKFFQKKPSKLTCSYSTSPTFNQ